MNDKIGIIGFGTVGSVLSNIFTRAGATFAVYDIQLENPSQREKILNKAMESGATVMDLPSLIEQSAYLVSAVTTQVAETVAKECLPYLKQGQTYLDCNSTSPGIKVHIKNIIQAGKADFVEGVILNAVHPGDSALDMLIGGKSGEGVAGFLEKSGVRARFFSEEIGKASMFKMLRSIFSKGVEALLLEMMVTAHRAGMGKELWREITAYMDSKPFEQIGGTWVRSHATAYERRFHEVQQVIETMQQVGVSPILTQATLQYFEQSMSLDLKSFFSEAPSGADEVVSVLASQLEAKAR